ncbi:MAG: hypothetical protein KDC78_09675 [Aequorivita sp.]|nr:hypothetical protein [Aequorivita sp.]
MAPYKLEDNIREKLEARELKPSADAWKKLEAKLDAGQPKKKAVVLYYVAASFVGILILASFFFTRNSSGENNQIVNETIEQNNIEKQPEIIPNDTKIEEIASEENHSEKQEAVKSKGEERQKPKSTSIKLLPHKKSEIDKKVDKTDAIAKVTKVEAEQPLKTSIQNTTQNQNKEDKLFNQKIEEVVASVKKLQENNTEVNTTDVEALLNNARREIETQRIINNPKVDATALLEDVEWELEKSFRDKVFDALGEGYNKVRTAVSERND